MLRPHLYAYNENQWLDWLSLQGYSREILPYVLDYVYQDKFSKSLPRDFDSQVMNNFEINLPKISHVQTSQDQTSKFLVEFNDGLQVESVLIPFHKKPTICLSSQVGCAMNCSFCYTGTQGLKRNLATEEIIGQYLVVYRWMKENFKSSLKPNIVFMGQGEPMHNWNALKKAIDIFLHPKMMGLGPRQLTLSTACYLAQIEMKNLPPINYALSLHSPFDEQRTQLIPINQKFSLKETLDKLDQINLLPKQFITYEYLLIKDFNMSDAHADALARLLGPRKALINLIPFNPFPGSHFSRPQEEEIHLFKEKLVAKKLRVMIRTTKGDDILAACGQLKVNKFSRIKHV